MPPPVSWDSPIRRTVLSWRVLQAAEQPDPGALELALDGRRRHLERLADLGVGQAAEVGELDGVVLAGVEGPQALEGLIERDEVDVELHADGDRLVEGQRCLAAAVAHGMGAAGMVDQDEAHGAGGDGEKVPAIGELQGRVAPTPLPRSSVQAYTRRLAWWSQVFEAYATSSPSSRSSPTATTA